MEDLSGMELDEDAIVDMIDWELMAVAVAVLSWHLQESSRSITADDKRCRAVKEERGGAARKKCRIARKGG